MAKKKPFSALTKLLISNLFQDEIVEGFCNWKKSDYFLLPSALLMQDYFDLTRDKGLIPAVCLEAWESKVISLSGFVVEAARCYKLI